MEEASRTSFFIFTSKNDNVIQKDAKNRPFLPARTAAYLCRAAGRCFFRQAMIR